MKGENRMSKAEIMSVEIQEVVWDKDSQHLVIYYEDVDALNAWCERHNAGRNKPHFLKEINYDLSNPNQMFNILCKVRNLITHTGVDSKTIYKEYKTYEQWFQAIIGTKVNLNSYGYLE